MNEKDLQNASAAANGPNTEPSVAPGELGRTLDSTIIVEDNGRSAGSINGDSNTGETGPVNVIHKTRARKVYGGMWGPVELAAASGSFLAILLVILAYFFLVLPSAREIEHQRAERDRLEKELASARSKYGAITNTEAYVASLVSSVGDFESLYLPVAETGRTALYQRINGLIASYGLVNTTGPDYSPLEVADQEEQKQGEEERGKAKFRSSFPGVYVTMTVEGTYQNLRRFIQALEAGNEFVIISTVELEPSETEQKNTQNSGQTENPMPVEEFPMENPRPSGFPPARGFPAPAPAPMQQTVTPVAPKGKTHGATVRLRLEMAAYFRRPNGTPAGTAPAAQQ